MTNVEALDCSACKGSQTMVTGRANRHSDGTRAIGYAIGAIGLVIGFVAFLIAKQGLLPQAGGGVEVSNRLALLVGGAVGIPAVLLVAVAAALTGQRDVWRCSKCGFVLDRSR